MSEQHPEPIDVTTPSSPSIPSFASLRDPQRRSPLDALFAPVDPDPTAEADPADVPELEVPELEPSDVEVSDVEVSDVEVSDVEVSDVEVSRPAHPTPPLPGAPRPAEWVDLLIIGARLADTAVRTASDLLRGVRAILRG